MLNSIDRPISNCNNLYQPIDVLLLERSELSFKKWWIKYCSVLNHRKLLLNGKTIYSFSSHFSSFHVLLSIIPWGKSNTKSKKSFHSQLFLKYPLLKQSYAKKKYKTLDEKCRINNSEIFMYFLLNDIYLRW